MIRVEEPKLPVSRIRVFLNDGEYWAIVLTGTQASKFGPDSDLEVVVHEAQSAIDNYLKGAVGEFVEGEAPIVVDPQSMVSLDELIKVIKANNGSRRLDLSQCDLDRIDASRGILADKLLDADSQTWKTVLAAGGGLALQEVKLEETKVWGSNFRGASFFRTSFSKAELMNSSFDDAIFWHADFTDAAVFPGVSFRRAGFFQANLRNLDLFDSYLEGSFWQDAQLGGTRMRAERLKVIGEELSAKGKMPYAVQSMLIHPTFRDAREAYINLKANFNTIGRYGDASWAYVKERQMDRAAAFPTTSGYQWIRAQARQGIRQFGRAWRQTVRQPAPRSTRMFIHFVISLACYIRLFLGVAPRPVRRSLREPARLWMIESKEIVNRPKWMLSVFYELAAGYGERPANAVYLGGVIMCLFAIGYFVTNAVNDFRDAVIYSLATFTTLNLADSGVQPHGRWMNVASSIEALLGISVLALVMFTLGNRMSRS